MCYTGGPYCYDTSKKRLESLKEKARHSHSIETQKALTEAQDDYDGTVQGQKELQQRIDQSPVQGEKEYLTLKKKRTASLRKEKINKSLGRVSTCSSLEKTHNSDEKLKQIGMTPVGSRLYGTHHADSDYDYVMLFTDESKVGLSKYKNLTQRLQGDDDVQRRSLDSFVASCYKGSANDLDVLYSTQWEHADNKYAPFLNSIRPDYSQARQRFRGFIEGFKEEQTLKATRHMFRVALNGKKLFSQGRYNPTHTDRELDFLNTLANKHQYTDGDKKFSLASDFMMGGRIKG